MASCKNRPFGIASLGAKIVGNGMPTKPSSGSYLGNDAGRRPGSQEPSNNGGDVCCALGLQQAPRKEHHGRQAPIRYEDPDA